MSNIFSHVKIQSHFWVVIDTYEVLGTYKGISDNSIQGIISTAEGDILTSAVAVDASLLTKGKQYHCTVKKYRKFIKDEFNMFNKPTDEIDYRVVKVD